MKAYSRPEWVITHCYLIHAISTVSQGQHRKSGIITFVVLLSNLLPQTWDVTQNQQSSCTLKSWTFISLNIMKTSNCQIIIFLHTNKKSLFTKTSGYKTIRNVRSLYQNEKWPKAAPKIVQWQHVCTAIYASCFYFVHLGMCCSITYLIFLLADEAPFTLSKTMRYSRHKHILQLLTQDKYEQVNQYTSKFWKRNLCFWEH